VMFSYNGTTKHLALDFGMKLNVKPEQSQNLLNWSIICLHRPFELLKELYSAQKFLYQKK